MPKASEKTMRELEDILNESETYADRLAAFLKQKTAPPKSQCNEPFALDDLDLTFDLDVDLVKLPAKPVPIAKKKAEEFKEQGLREITSQSVLAGDSKALEPQTVPNSQDNSESLASPVHIKSPSHVSTSPRRSAIRRSGYHVPGSDRLRRVAIHRRSRSCGRRDLLKEFNDLSTCNAEFRPPLNSTPDSEKKPSEKTTQISETPTPNPTLKNALPDDVLSQASMPLHSTTSNASTKRRTYTIEMGPEPGQLLLSPSNKGNPNSLRQRLSQLSPSNSNTSLRLANLERTRHQAELSAARLKILAQDTPIRSYSPIQQMPDFIVPESQPMSQLQPGNQMMQNFAGNTVVAPLMVVPMASVLSVNTQPGSTPTRPTQVDAAAQVKATTAPTVTSRSMQTSNSLRFVQDENDIMTEDDSSEENQVSTAPLNLAPPGGNINRKRNLRIRVKRVDSSTELLDLHRSGYKASAKRNKSKPRQTVLNKPSQPAINGEQFAYELARMSNYEILDLRKRKSMGRQYPINGHREQPTEQELLMEQHIEWEILRRHLDEPNERMATTIPINDTTVFETSLAAPSNNYRDVSMPKRHEDNEMTQQRRSRPSRRDSVMRRDFSSPLPPPAGFGDYSMQTRQQRAAAEQKSPERMRSRHYEPPDAFGDNSMQTRQQRAAAEQKSPERMRSRHYEPPDAFGDNSMQTRQQRAAAEQKSKERLRSRHYEPPDAFGDNSMQTRQQRAAAERKSIERVRSRQYEPPMSEDELLTVCTPPSQFRKSRSRYQKNHSQQQQKDHTPPAPPLEFNNMPETESEEEIQESELELLPPAQFFDELKESGSSVEGRRLREQIDTNYGNISYRIEKRTQEGGRLENEIGKNDQEARQQKEIQDKHKKENLQKEMSLRGERGKQIQSEKQHQEKNSRRSQRQEHCSHVKNQRKSQQQEQQLHTEKGQAKNGEMQRKILQQLQLENEHEKSLQGKEQPRRGKNQRKSQLQENRQQEESIHEEVQLHDENNQSNIRSPRRENHQAEEQTDGHQQLQQDAKQRDSRPENEQLDQEKEQQKKGKKQRKSHRQEKGQQEESIHEEVQLHDENNQSNIRSPRRENHQLEEQIDGHQQLQQDGKQKDSRPESEQLDQEKEQQKKGKKQRKSHRQEERQHEGSMLKQKKLNGKEDEPKTREDQAYSEQQEEQTVGHQHSDSIYEQEQAPPPPAPSDHVFKKPTAPAPRAKQKSKLERQLQKLHINLSNKTLAPEDNGEIDANTTVRRSKRGQVPLCNTWVHTQTDPFSFMRKNLEPTASTSKRNKRAESTARGSSVKSKGPLYSSTPRTTPDQNGKRKRPPQNIQQANELCDIDALSGISRLSDISEGEEMEQTPGNARNDNLQISEKSSDALDEAKKSKTGKTNIPQTPATEVDSATEFPSASPNTIQPEQQPSETLLSWLCGGREVPTDGNDITEVRNEAMTVARASNLQFSNVEGIEYAFYQTEDLYSMGYMRFQPLQQRGMKLARTNTLRFVTLHGQFDVAIQNQETKHNYEGILNAGDVIEVKKGNRYNISNRLNQVGIIMVYRNTD